MSDRYFGYMKKQPSVYIEGCFFMAAGVINVPAQLSGSRMTDAALQGNSRMLPIGRAQKKLNKSQRSV
ncbi:MAG: hypothetical protein SOT57_03550 [Eubacteriales bacterium]|nr:hypothetical protein [Eubacteriales bacterium]